VTSPVTHLISLEVFDPVKRVRGGLATCREWAFITVVGMEAVVYMAHEVFRTVEPWANPDEDAAGKPIRAIVTVGRTVIRRDIVVPIGTDRRCSDLDTDTDLSVCLGGSSRQTDSQNTR
jgi:hypothetical protein